MTTEREQAEAALRGVTSAIGNNPDVFALSVDEQNLVRISLKSGTDEVVQYLTQLLRDKNITTGFRFVGKKAAPISVPPTTPAEPVTPVETVSFVAANLQPAASATREPIPLRASREPGILGVTMDTDATPVVADTTSLEDLVNQLPNA